MEPLETDLRRRRHPLTTEHAIGAEHGEPEPGAGAAHPSPALLDPRVVAVGACGAVISLGVSSTGLLVVAALGLGVAMWSAASTLAALLAVAAVAVRWGVTDFVDLAGVQSVLGPAGAVGSAGAAASAWLAAGAILLSTRSLPAAPTDGAGAPAVRWSSIPGRGSDRLSMVVPAVAAGTFAAAIAAGPGPNGDLVVRLAASVVGVVVAVAVARATASAPVSRIVHTFAVVAAVGAIAAAAAS